jgi:peptidoglycan-associated lipoprotein
MKNMLWLILLLTGCGCRHCVVHTPDPPPPPAFRGSSPPPVTPVVNRVPSGVVTVMEPESVHLPKTPPESVRIKEVNAALEDAYFAYDRADLSAEAFAALHHDADLLCAILAEFPGLKVTLEGHCDERGSAEYNLALGDRRARRAEDVLRERGVPPAAVQVVSYGKENPQCLEPTEACRQRNRRAHISVGRVAALP